MEEQPHIHEIFKKYLANEHTAEELNEILAYFQLEERSAQLEDMIIQQLNQTPDTDPVLLESMVVNVNHHLAKNLRTKPKINRKWLPYAAAAILLVALAAALYFQQSKSTIADITPGYNQATLTLADGTKVALDSAQSGIIVNDEDIKYNNGKLVQNVIPTKAEGSLPAGKKGAETRSTPLRSAQGDVLLALSTPKGGQYQIILSDGTKVWLNAASTLTYPSHFSGDSREVNLEGEAYFEVNNKPVSIGPRDTREPAARAGSRVSRGPFLVKTKNQEITVLGTSFNVTAYADAKEMKTTLVEGKVQVRSEDLERKTYNVQLLRPQQQAVVKGNSLTVRKVDIDTELAWRNNKFSFDNKPFTQIMTEMGRWYNFEVTYEGPIPTNRFMGDAYRTDKFISVLHFLENAGLDYRIEATSNHGHRLVIINKKENKQTS